MIRRLLPPASLLVQLHSISALAQATPDAETAARTLAQNLRVELPAPPPASPPVSTSSPTVRRAPR